MKKILKIVLIVFGSIMIIGLIATIFDDTDNAKKTDDKNSKTEKSAIDANRDKEIEAEKNAKFDRDVKIVDSLKGNFLAKTDEFKNVTWYTHKTWGKYWPNRKTLVVKVNGQGQYYTESNYYDDDWLFHKKVIVKLGARQVESPVISVIDKRHVTDNDGGYVWEINRYVGDDIENIAKDIFDYTDKEPIKIRFEGEQFVKDITLPDKDRKAINESVMFAEALSNTWNKIGGPKLEK